MQKGDIITDGPVNLPAWSVVMDSSNRLLQRLNDGGWTDLDLIIRTDLFHFPVEVIRVGA